MTKLLFFLFCFLFVFLLFFCCFFFCFFCFLFFIKNSHSDFDLQHMTLKVKLARDNIIPNICVKLYPSINVGSTAMTVFVLKIATVTLTLSPGP